MRKRWNFFLLKLAMWRLVTRKLWRAKHFNATVLHNTDDRMKEYHQYPGATTIHLIIDGRRGASS